MTEHFNPRVPCGTRLGVVLLIGIFFYISIHGSRVGPDYIFLIILLVFLDFNPRVPCGTRRISRRKTGACFLFQSTGPVWDPTITSPKNEPASVISIHGSRVGPDFAAVNSKSVFKYFNPRVPCGTRQEHKPASPEEAHFNPRVPCGTRHAVFHLERQVREISIHGSRVGPDPSG